MSKVLEVILKLVDQMTPQMEKAASSVKRYSDTVDSSFSKIETKNGAVARATETLGNAYNKLKEKAKSATDSLANGLDNAANKVNAFTDKLGMAGTALTSVFGALGLGSIYDLTVGLAMARENMYALMVATSGSTAEATRLMDTLDKITDASVVGLSELGTSMNNIKMTTGMTTDQLIALAPAIDKIGQMSAMMGHDTTRQMEMMSAAGRALNGDFELLRTNLGITKDMLMDAGWSGAADDVDGFNDALNEVMETKLDIDTLLSTTTGQLALLQKIFRRVGREIGEVVLPVIKALLIWFKDLNESNPLLAKIIILLAGFGSIIALVLPVLGILLSGMADFVRISGKIIGKLAELIIGKISDAGATAAQTTATTTNTGAFTANTTATTANTTATNKGIIAKLASVGALIKEKIQLALSAIWKGIVTVATYAWAAAQWVLNAALSANPIALVIIAIAALVAIILYAWYNVDWFREGVLQLWDALQNKLRSAVDAVIEGWNRFLVIIQPVIDIIMWLLAPLIQFLGVLWQLATGNISLSEAVNQSWTIIKDRIIEVLGGVWSRILGFLNYLGALPQMIWMHLLSIVMRFMQWRQQVINQARNAAMGVINGVIGFLTSLPGRVWGLLKAVGQRIMAIGGEWYRAAWNAAVKIWEGFKSALGIKSPSYLEKAMFNIEDESNNMWNILKKDADKIKGLNYGGDAKTNIAMNNQGILKVQHQHEFHGLPAGVNEKEVARLVNQSLNDSRVRESLEVATYQTQRNILKPQGGL